MKKMVAVFLVAGVCWTGVASAGEADVAIAKKFLAQTQASKDGVSWAGLHMGMTAQQVNHVLGSPLKLKVVHDEMEGGNRYEGTTVRAGVPVRLVFQSTGKERRLAAVSANLGKQDGSELFTSAQVRQLTAEVQKRINGLRKACKECALQRGIDIVFIDVTGVGLSLDMGE